MILFGYERSTGIVGPRKGDLESIIITNDENGNVLIHRYDEDATLCTLDSSLIWDIETMILEHLEDIRNNNHRQEDSEPLDVGYEDFLFGDDNEVVYLARYESEKENIKEDDIYNLVNEIENVLLANQINVKILE